MKKIMIIGAGLLQMYIIKRAKELGYITIVVDGDENAEGFKYADYYKVISIVDEEKCLEYAKEMNIDGVLTAATDYGVLTASYIAREMGLNGISYETAKLVKNKFEIRKRLSEKKLDDTPQHFLITSIEQIKEIENKIKYPVIIKPCDGSGSKGVNRVEDKFELKDACKKAIENSLTNKVLIETFIVGKEYGVESFVYNNDIYVLGIMEKIMTKAPYYAELGHNISYSMDKKLEDKIKRLVKDSIKALQINFGSVNMDILITDKNEVCIVDIGARMGGNLIGSHIIPIATGIDYMGNIIKAALKEEVDFTEKCHNVVATRLMDFTPGTVKKMPNFLEYFKDEDVKDIVCKLKVGDKINSYKNNLDGCGYIVVSNSDINIAKDKALNIKNKINKTIKRIEDECYV